MYIKNCTEGDLQDTLDTVNKRFAGNIVFKRLERRGKRFLITLTIKNSAGPGGSRSAHRINKDGERAKIAAACWHVHGHFFSDLLDIAPTAEIRALDKVINIEGGNWQDFNRGSRVFPYAASDCCEC